MTPLGAAQRLAGEAPFLWIAYDRKWRCFFCDIAMTVKGARVDEEDFEAAAAAYDAHAPNCMWLAMPRIVAALEAAEQLVQEDAHTNDYEVPYQGQMACNSCGAITRSHAWTDKEGRTFPAPHPADCSWQALKAALKGDA